MTEAKTLNDLVEHDVLIYPSSCLQWEFRILKMASTLRSSSVISHNITSHAKYHEALPGTKNRVFTVLPAVKVPEAYSPRHLRCPSVVRLPPALEDYRMWLSGFRATAPRSLANDMHSPAV